MLRLNLLVALEEKIHNKKAPQLILGASFTEFGGANDGARTRDNQNHNLGLYQLSYVRRCRDNIIAFCLKSCQK